MHNDSAPLDKDHQSSVDFAGLIRAARNGSDQAMDQLIRECQPYLLAIANVEIDTAVARKVGASDIVQNSMLSAQRCIADFEGETREQLLAWVRGILIKDLQQAHRYYHAQRRHVDRERPIRGLDASGNEFSLVDDGASPSELAAEREQEQRLYRAMRRLSPHEREVIELRNWQRLPFAEIGQRMDRSAEASRKLWSRAIVRLERLMGGVDE